MSTYPEYHETASAVERIARTVGDDQALARAALHLAAHLLRGDERAAHERLTRLLHLVDVGELISSASSMRQRALWIPAAPQNTSLAIPHK